ncbi:MAG: NADH-quinone oxidoreductase subunit C [Candidatus Omnitrophica bacterium]|nr:NADH-quinone oxidoreductase subunit C [Candidatus Omnitrophota bacterium]
MSPPAPLVLKNPQSVDEAAIPVLPIQAFRDTVLLTVSGGARLSAFFGRLVDGEQVKVYALLAHDETGECAAIATVMQDSYPSLAPECPQAHWFERELAEQFAVRPEGHPWFKPLRFHRNYRGAPDLWPGRDSASPIPGGYPFFHVKGSEIHEVAVGPVHAGIIEPGHFRFQCHGERVLHLEIQLGYQHRGVEQRLAGGPAMLMPVVVESIAGDTVIGHGLAFCEAMEALGGCQISPRAQALRGVALELERLANHVGDLGALGADVGFLPSAAYFGRLRGEFLNLLMELTGNRYGRSFLRPGGVSHDLGDTQRIDGEQRLARARKELRTFAAMLFDAPSVIDRFEGTGIVTRQVSEELGLVGPAARACGSPRDVRHDHPSGIYRFAHLPMTTAEAGDVHARALIRWLEAERSLEFLLEQLAALPEGELRAPCSPAAPNSVAFSMVEGWRGEIMHVVITHGQGGIARYKVIDPSFHNWMGLAMALREGEISDFPLCNKSFNLSYAGHDL